MVRDLQFATLRHDTGQPRYGICTSGNILDLAYSQHAINDLPKHDILVVQPLTFVASDEKLASVRVWPAVGLRKYAIEDARRGVCVCV